MSSNFTRSPESVIFITGILGYIVGIAAVICSSWLIFIAIRNSPREMGAYKWYIIFNATCCAGYDLMFCLIHPEPLFPQTMILFGGLLKHWVISSFSLYFVFYAALFFITGILYSMPLLFLYRYLQTVNSRFLKMFSRGTPSLLLCSAGHCLLFVPPFIVLHIAIVSQSELKEFLHVNDTMLYTYAHNRNIIGFERGKSSFSSRTLQLYRSLINALMIDVAICEVMVILPVVLCCLSMYFQLEWGSTATLFAMSFASWYPIVSHIVWMWFIAPYRRALIRMFTVVCNLKVENVVNSDVLDNRLGNGAKSFKK